MTYDRPARSVTYDRGLPDDDTGEFVVSRELMDDLADPDED